MTPGSPFVGLYVYGSLCDEVFIPLTSDMDCIVVTRRPLDASTFSRLDAWLGEAAAQDPCVARLQMSFLVRDRLLDDDPTSCLYQFGALGRSGSDGNPIIWLDFFQRGLTLRGEDPRAFVPAITPDILHDALVRERRSGRSTTFPGRSTISSRWRRA